MPEDDLRSALRALAEPVAPPPGGREAIWAGVDADRPRRWVVPLLAAAAVLAVGVGVGIGSISSTGEPNIDSAVTTRPETTEPYDAPSCPETLPDREEMDTRVPDLRGATSVRLCGDTRDFEFLADPPTVQELDAAPGPEALVSDLEGFADQIRAIPATDQGRCATIDLIPSSTSLVITYPDRVAIVPATICTNLRLQDRVIDAAELRYAFDDALDRQRDQYAYGRTIETPLACRTFRPSGPVRFDRERIVAAVRCDPSTGSPPTPTALPSRGMERLQDAWTRARVHVNDVPLGTEDDCTELEERPIEIIARTDRGDVVRLFESPCGYLVLDGDRPGESFDIPVTAAQLELLSSQARTGTASSSGVERGG
jgi:hypothetical protein